VRHRLIVPAAALAALTLAIPASAAEPSPGAPGAGDPYYPDYGNGGYDVSHYDLRLNYQPKTDKLDGTATILATTTQDLSRFNLDFALKVSEVRVNGEKATTATSGAHELEVTPARALAKGRHITVVVRYSGTPSKVKVGGVTTWHRTPDGAVAADEPESAWWWYPSNDHPSDKATYDISTSVPKGTQVLSNGLLKSQSTSAGTTRYNWRNSKPQATYLTTLAIGKFDITEGKTKSGIPVINAYSKDLGADAGAARASIERTGEIIDWIQTVAGKYPFESVGGYAPNVDAGFALETETRPFYGRQDFDNGSNVGVVVHELAHQWYGDDVSVRRWQDIWLNEGFASYVAWLWSEHQGEGTTKQLADYAYAQHPADDTFWKIKPGDPGAENQFDDAVYDRGAMALEALREKLGDKDFFAVLKGWPASHAGGNATVKDFETYAEKISGKPLASLLDTWLYKTSKPKAPAFGERGAGQRSTPERPASWSQLHTVNATHHRR
jgi:aminopeptidase N